MSKKIIINSDLNLKLMCKELFKQMGFCTHYEIQLRTKSYISSYKTHDISDIDVYGYRFNADLSLFSIGSECKSGETGALEELFKFLGVYDYYDLDRGYLIKTKIHQNARQVASKNGLICFTESEIRQILLGQDIDVDKILKIGNAQYLKLQQCVNNFKAKNEKLIDYIKFDYWNRENWRNIHNLMHLLSNPHNEEFFPNDNLHMKTNDKLVYYHVLELLILCILKNISKSIVLSYSDISSSLIISLYGGAESLNEKRKLHDLVSQATSSNNPFEPSWQYDLIHISTRFAEATMAASKMPELVQEILDYSFYEDKVIIKPTLLKKYPDLTRKFVQDVIQFIQRHCKIDLNIFEDFMKL